MDKDTKVRLTSAPISDSLCSIINRLSAGHYVPYEDVMETPEMRLVEQVKSQAPKPTKFLDQAPRRVMQTSIAKDMANLGSYTHSEKAFFFQAHTFRIIVAKEK
jgi:hypothetical protein